MSWRVRPWFLIVVLAVFVTRLGGVHLHLCFDGQEPPATLHVADNSLHGGEHHVDEQHSDQDVDLGDAVLVKKSSSSLELPVLFVACVLLLLLSPASRSWPGAAFYRVFAYHTFRLRPPLRGPPL